MPRPCSICRHPQREEIEAALAGGGSFRNLGKRYATSATAIFRHQAHAQWGSTRGAAEIGGDQSEETPAAKTQGRRPPGRREKVFALSHQDREMLNLLATGAAQTVAQAAEQVGMSKGSGYAVVDSLTGRKILKAAFRAQGLTEAQLAAKVVRLVDATTTRFFQKDGVVKDQRDVADNQTQLGAARLAAELMDLKPQEKDQPKGPPAGVVHEIVEREVTLPDGTRAIQRVVRFEAEDA
jgi:hypothetical protein